MKIKKFFSGLLLSAAVVSSLGTVVFAAVPTTNYSYSNQDLAVGHNYSQFSYLEGFYEMVDNGKYRRAATHYNAGNTSGYATVRFTFTDSKGTHTRQQVSDFGTGWLDSQWFTIPGNTFVSKIYFEGTAINKNTKADIARYLYTVSSK